MITLNGKVVVIKSNPTKKTDKWAKDACNRILSHYSNLELETLRNRGGFNV